MKSRKRVLACLLIMTFMVAMIPGRAKASTHELPFAYPNEANVETNNDVWVVVFGGSAAPPLTNNQELANSIRSVSVFFGGNATFDLEVIINSNVGWVPFTYPGINLSGGGVSNVPIVNDGVNYLEVIVNVKNKTEGPLSVTRMEFKDEAGVVVLTHGGPPAPPIPEIGFTIFDGINYELNMNTRTAKVVGYTGVPEDVVIPNSFTTDFIPPVSGAAIIFDVPFTVTGMWPEAFKSSSITSVTIPDTITRISHGAFQDCWGLREVRLPSTLEAIDGYAFSWCGGLQDIEIPAGVTYINEDAFKGSEHINIIAEEGSYAYQYAQDNNLINYIDYSFNPATGVMTLSGKGKIKDYWGALETRPWHQDAESVTSLVIKSGITKIGGEAFGGFYNLKNIYFEEGVTEIGGVAFNNGWSLQEVKLPSTLKKIEGLAFAWCEELGDIEIPSGVTSIAEDAFLGSPAVNIIAESGTYAYDYLQDYKLKQDISYSIKDGVMTVSGIGGIPHYKNQKNSPWLNDKDQVTKIIIDGDFSFIGADAFKEFNNLTSVVIPEGITVIREGAFSDSPLLSEIKFPSTLIRINNNAFEGCSSLTEITIPNGVTTILEYAFARCTSLTSISIPDSLTNLADNAFEGSDNLKFTISFNSKGGSAVAAISKAYNASVSAPGIPQRSGYSFGGWYLDEALTTQYSFTTMPAKNITLYAKWTYDTPYIPGPGPAPQTTPSPTPKPTEAPKPSVKDNEDGTKTETVEISDKDNKATATVNIIKDDKGNITNKSSSIKINTAEVIEDKDKTEIKATVDKDIVDRVKEYSGSMDSFKMEIKLPEEQIIKRISSDTDKKPVTVSIEIPSEVSKDDKAQLDKITLSKELLSKTKDAETSLSVAVKDEYGEESFSWSFDGLELKDSDKDITDVNLMMSVSQADKHENTQKLVSELNKADNTPAITVSFNHSGELPATAQVRVNLKSLLAPSESDNEEEQEQGMKPGSEVYVYYYNNVTGKLEVLPNNKYVIDDDGFITLMITHCSDYVILSKPAGSDQTTDLLSQIEFSPNKALLYFGETDDNSIAVNIKLPATLRRVSEFTNSDKKEAIAELVITFKSSDSKVAKVFSNGLIKAVGAGTAVITANAKLADGIEKELTVNIRVEEAGTSNDNKVTNPAPDKKKEPVVPDVSSKVNEEIYIVKKGDTLWKIAKKYKTTVNRIVKKNGIKNPNLIHIGQRIKL